MTDCSRWTWSARVLRVSGLVGTAAIGLSCMPEPEEVTESGTTAPLPGMTDVADPRRPAAQDVESVRYQIPGRDLQEQPPKIRVAELFAVQTRPEGNARLEVTFDEPMPAQVKLIFGGTVRELNDVGTDADRTARDGVYAAIVRAEQSEVDSAEQARGDGRPANENTALVASEVYPTAKASLVITHLDVVNDPDRVSDPCVSFVSPSVSTKEWSFGYLMTHMANTASTKISASTFAKTWMNTWKSTSTVVNGDAVVPLPSNPGTPPGNISVPQYLLDQWTLASRLRSDGSLDPNTNPNLKMEKAPFRLLAIVYRPDLRRPRFFGEGTAGELRFVFGALDSHPDHNVPGEHCQPLDTPTTQTDFKNTTVILEYAVDKADVRDWVRQWRDLVYDWDQDTDAPTPDYRNALQGLTEQVVRAGVGGSRANGSALIRIRTNESIDSLEWRLREFKIGEKTKAQPRCDYTGGVCVPVADTVKQTPRAIRNGSTLLGQYINAKRDAILQEMHNVPKTYNGFSFLGGQAINPPSSDNIHEYWRAPNISGDGKMISLLRHKFSLNTCNGCHTAETGTHFAHIMSRRWDEEAQLSGFMTGEFCCEQGAFYAEDPVTKEKRYFGEFPRREADMFQVLVGSSTAALMFQPTSRVH